jgi:hypothetical protein
MAQKTCSQCSTIYDDATVNIPSPLPDRTCFECGTELTDEKIQSLIPEHIRQMREEQTQGT